jgi:sigma-E factor negative regulatory protein RseA
MSERMKDALNEQLSACLDGELPPAELDLLLKQVGKEAELRAAIGRYSLIGEAMRAERPAVASRDFASKMMAAVAAETPLKPSAVTAADKRPAVAGTLSSTRPGSSAAARYLRPAIGMAIAAGVAAVAVLTIQPPAPAPFQANAPAELASAEAQLVAANEPELAATDNADPSYVVPTSTSSSAFIPATRLTNYVVAHSEYSSPLGRRSVLSGVLADDEEVDAAQNGSEEDAPVQISTSDDDGAPER